MVIDIRSHFKKLDRYNSQNAANKGEERKGTMTLFDTKSIID